MIKLTPVKPKATVFNLKQIERAVKDGVKDTAEEVKDAFEQTTRTWSSRPDFTVTQQRDGYSVGTDSDVWRFLDEGTRSYDIRPKRTKVLRFQSGYSAKTKPRAFSSSSGGTRGSVIFRPRVRHPGIKARRWSSTAKDKYQGQVALAINERLADVFRRGRD